MVSTTEKPIVLHHQDLAEGSESVSVGTQALHKGAQYAIDYAKGTVRILSSVMPGQKVSVSYQPKQPQPVPGSAAKAAPSLPESTKTPVQRLRDFLSLNKTALTLGHADNLEASSSGTSSAPAKPGYYLEDLSTGLAHGIVSVAYEEIGEPKPPSGASETVAQSPALAQSNVKKLGIAMEGVELGSMRLDNSFRLASDGNGSVAMTDIALKNGPLSLTFSGQRVSNGFLQFGALPDDSRDALMHSSGLNIQDFGATYKSKSSSMGFSSDLTMDSAGQKIAKNSFSLQSNAVKLDAGEQSVGLLFTQFASLPGADQQMLAAEAGTDKKWLSFETAPISKTGQPLKFSGTELTGPMGSYASADVSAGGKGWTLDAGDRKNNNSFALQPDIDQKLIDGDVLAISKMYSPAGSPITDIDKSSYLFGNLDRSFVRFTDKPSKTSSFDLEDVTLKGATDMADMQTATATTAKLDFSLQHTHVGQNFYEDSELMDFEQQKLGMDLGVDRTDVKGDYKFTGTAKLTFNLTNTDTQQGNAMRGGVEYAAKGIDLSYNDHNVAPGFASITNFGTTGLTDPDAGMLAALNGFRDQTFQGHWTPSPKFNAQVLWEDQHNDAANQDGFDHVINATWDPNKTTHLTYNYLDTESWNPTDTIYDSRTSTFLLSKDFGKAGKLQLVHEEVGVVNPTNGAPFTIGQQAPPLNPTDPQGDSREDSLTYTANLDKKTQFQTQDSNTRFGDGSYENITANTINRSLTPHFGLSYTEIQTDSTSTVPEAHKNNYGFWLDIAKSVRFSYGFVRNLNEFSGSTDSTTIGVTPGDAGPFHVDNVSTNSNNWDNLHNQVTSNYALHNTKPFKFGPLSNLNFSVNVATASDYSAYNQKNDVLSLSGKIAGSNNFLVSYKSLMDPTGVLDTDRFASFQTDPNPKKWIQADLKVKERESPTTGLVLIRDYSLTLRPIKNLEITNHMLTNPEVEFRPDLIMGSLTSPWRVNEYKLDYHTSADTTIGATYEERRNDLDNAYYRTAGMDMELFKTSGSPLTLWFGMEQGGGGGLPHEFAQRFYLKYFEKPGPNQTFNIFLGNLAYEYTNQILISKYNWAIHGEYMYSYW